MKSKLISFLVVILLLFGLTATPSLLQAGCFKDFENCMNSVRTSFLGGFIDALDCELDLAACIRKAIIG
ncbi:MAG: hypothetical protein ACOC5R_05825 [Elusimicrobiota bacterium]